MSDSASRRKFARLRFAWAGARLAVRADFDLPALILMTDDDRLPNPIAAARALPKGSMVIARTRGDLWPLALALRGVAQERGLFLSVAGEVALAEALGADGVHLPEARLGEAAAIRARSRLLITASAHSFAAVRRAAWVDALILSPVFATASHPGGAALGAVRANAMARQSPLPVYALGGITAGNAGRLGSFCGLAAIGALKV